MKAIYGQRTSSKKAHIEYLMILGRYAIGKAQEEDGNTIYWFNRNRQSLDTIFERATEQGEFYREIDIDDREMSRALSIGASSPRGHVNNIKYRLLVEKLIEAAQQQVS